MIVSQSVSKEVKRIQRCPAAGVRRPSKGSAVGLATEDDRGVAQAFDLDSAVLEYADVLGVGKAQETSSALVWTNFEQGGQGKCFPDTFQPGNQAREAIGDQANAAKRTPSVKAAVVVARLCENIGCLGGP